MIGWGVERYIARHAARVERSMVDPEAAQRATFRRLQRVLEGAETARASGFADARELEDCRDLPPVDSERLRPRFRRVFAGGDAERRGFGRSRVVAFGRTSGTAGSPKDIPINRAYTASIDRSLTRMVACYLHATGAWRSFFGGRQILLTGRPFVEASPTGLPVVDISGWIPTRTWPLLRGLYLPRRRDLWIREWPERAERTLEQAAGQDVTAISGIPALAKDFARRVRDRHGGAHLGELWPNLRFYVFGAVGLPERERAELRAAWFGADAAHPLHFVETYIATEGFLAHSFRPDDEGLALNLLELLFTFRERASDRTALLAHELEASKTYLLHVTTPGGLVDYAMGDRVEVVSERPLRIRIVGRDAEEVSLTGEKITAQQLRLAVEAVWPGSAFVVWPEAFGGRPRLMWGIAAEPRGAAAESVAESVERSARRLDRALSRVNVQFDEALNLEGVVAPSRVVAVPADRFETYLRTRLGEGQFKPKRIFASRRDAEAALGWRAPS